MDFAGVCVFGKRDIRKSAGATTEVSVNHYPFLGEREKEIGEWWDSLEPEAQERIALRAWRYKCELPDLGWKWNYLHMRTRRRLAPVLEREYGEQKRGFQGKGDSQSQEILPAVQMEV